jgi:hypothetical protein
MRIRSSAATRKPQAVIGGLCAAALGTAACAGGIPTGPSTNPLASGVAIASGAEATGRVAASSSAERRGILEVTKECSEYTGLAGSFCTVTASNLDAIEVGSRIIYAQAAGAAALDSDVVLDLPGPGNNQAFGHCYLESATGLGLCTFSGGTGKFTWFQASEDVSYLGGPNWGWTGTYTFSARD